MEVKAQLSKTCTRCKAPFECGASAGKCWCMDVPIKKLGALQDCLCPTCLQRETTDMTFALPRPEDQQVAKDIWKDKYAGTDVSLEATFLRVHTALTEGWNQTHKDDLLMFLNDRAIVPAGRILAGAGTDKRVTLINCFVSPVIQDSMRTHDDREGVGIMDALAVAAYTQQMGGGIGMGFGTVRPRGATVKRTGSVSSGVVEFMRMWNAMCGTIKSSGSRRGAMMATLPIWHPDIEEFITAKHVGGQLTNFNVSILVTDEFMTALHKGGDWDLTFPVPRDDDEHVDIYEKDGVTQYVYKRVKAADLWALAIRSTYEHAEPGVIFIDRVNLANNLYYCEDIQATNPCGEQPLPPNGDCNLGHINLNRFVAEPFTPNAHIDEERLKAAVASAVRMLDSVIDHTQFPTEEQAVEAFNKRRVGLGYTGLANMLQKMGHRYGSFPAMILTGKVTKIIAEAAYWTSVEMAKEKDPFPAYDAVAFSKAEFVQKLPEELQEAIAEFGIRNGVLLSLAPTGTTSTVLGNVSSGIEPVFSLAYFRKVLQEAGDFKEYSTIDAGVLDYWRTTGLEIDILSELTSAAREGKDLNKVIAQYVPAYFNTADSLSVEEHLGMQAAAQEWIDAAISKTVNCPMDMTYDDFQKVYLRAYELELKGCTTYRPNPDSNRGSVLSTTSQTAPAVQTLQPIPMQDILEGRRYRVNWPGHSAIYVSVHDYYDAQGARRPFEVFINTKDAVHDEWIKALALTITGIFRRGGDVSFVADELKSVISATGGQFLKGRYIPSLVAAIGDSLGQHFEWLKLARAKGVEPEIVLTKTTPAIATGLRCSKCSSPTLVKKEGCESCTTCGYSACG